MPSLVVLRLAGLDTEVIPEVVRGVLLKAFGGDLATHLAWDKRQRGVAYVGCEAWPSAGAEALAQLRDGQRFSVGDGQGEYWGCRLADSDVPDPAGDGVAIGGAIVPSLLSHVAGKYAREMRQYNSACKLVSKRGRRALREPSKPRQNFGLVSRR